MYKVFTIIYRASDLGIAVNSSAAVAFILPLFVPHFIAALSFPIAAVPALIELLFGKRMVKLNFWTTALVCNYINIIMANLLIMGCENRLD